jgi:hypothetical protein
VLLAGVPVAVVAAGRAVDEPDEAATAGFGADEAAGVSAAGRTVEENMEGEDEEVGAAEFAALVGFMVSEASFLGWDV